MPYEQLLKVGALIQSRETSASTIVHTCQEVTLGELHHVEEYLFQYPAHRPRVLSSLTRNGPLSANDAHNSCMMAVSHTFSMGNSTQHSAVLAVGVAANPNSK